MKAIRQLYDPALFTQVAGRIVALLDDYLRQSQVAPFKALPWIEPSVLKARAKELMDQAPAQLDQSVNPEAIADHVTGLARQFLTTNNRLHSPHYMGHQVAPSLPIAGFFEAIGSTTNQASGIYEMGPFPSAVERAMIEKLGSFLGWKDVDFDAIATHGGSAANLTAILAARNIRYGESWQKGIAASSAGGGRPAVLCSAESHYSIARAVAIAGLGADQVIKAPIDARRRLDVSKLEALLDQAKRDGNDVFCIVGSSCATPIGAFDELEPIGEICQRRGIWFHVDAAHGGGLFLSATHRHLLRGVERADSVTWDAHKMMFVPALSTFLFYRERRHSFQAFDQDAPYLFSKDENPTLEYDSAVRTLECTKRPIVMALWMMWCTFGPQVFEKLVDTTIALARTFHELLSESSDFEPLHEPECNILCFRHLPEGVRGATDAVISDFQATLRRELIQAGEFYITITRIDGVMALRVTLMNPLTTSEHLRSLIKTIRKVGESCRKA
jgi:L-2,4-diaminobutyrate decarboxylase